MGAGEIERQPEADQANTDPGQPAGEHGLGVAGDKRGGEPGAEANA